MWLLNQIGSRPLVLREDTVVVDYSKDEILRNAKITEEDYFVVPPGNVPLESEDLFEKPEKNKNVS